MNKYTINIFCDDILVKQTVRGSYKVSDFMLMFKTVWLPENTDIKLLSMWYMGSLVDSNSIFDEVFSRTIKPSQQMLIVQI